ncbi:MAG: IS110 family transposase [Myxococcales bacterium]|jgi:transposase|nr:IS110 family transposase [Myxococcales bacterium]
MKKFLLCGVDVGSKELVVAIESRSGRVWEGVFRNNSAGHRQLIRRLTRNKATARVCVEATGIYHLDLCLALEQTKGIEIMVANPRVTKDFARAQLRRSKTDRTDALSLLEFVRRMEFEAWVPPSSAIRALRALSRRIQALLVTRAQEKNRLHADASVEATPLAIRESIERHIAAINAEIEVLTESALVGVRADSELDRRFALLVSVKGIAQASAITLLAELSVLPADMSARQWVAHSGLDPKHCESGTSVKGRVRISKVGNRHLRAALFLPAMVASQHEPRVHAYYEKLLGKGKKPMQALVAVMRKLLHAIHGMFKHDAHFDGTKFFAERT